MGIVKVTKMNFTSMIKERMSEKNLGFEGMMAKALLGGEGSMKALDDLPDEEELYIDTRHVYAVKGLQKVSGTNDTVFTIYVDCEKDKDRRIFIKDNCFDEFMKEWNK